MKRCLILLFALMFLIGCSDDSSEVNPNEGKIVFSVDNVNYVSSINTISISKIVNQDDYSLTLSGIESMDENNNPTFSVGLFISFNFELSTNNYIIPNRAVSLPSEQGFGNTFGYTIGLSTAYTNNLCDATFQNGVDYGNDGNLTITEINLSDKNISGNFEMELCKGLGEYVKVNGSFDKVSFTLFE